MASKRSIASYKPRSKVNKFIVAIGIISAAEFATAAVPQLLDLASMSLEELGTISVTSVSREPQQLSQSPSAIQVITRDEIRRSGASNIPEALRLATNLQVAQANSQKWVITARGFSSDVGNKLLVMIDGRTVYTPLFSGVFWERQDYLLEDVERIEVISGPGGTLWGSNAVNGVINIITRSAAETQGAYVDAGGGSELHKTTSARYGGTLAPDVNYRVYGKYTDRDGSVYANGTDINDQWDMSQAGFRVDGEASAQNDFTVQGDFYRNAGGLATGGTTETKGVNVLGRWTHEFTAESDMILQMYFDRTSLSFTAPALIANNLPLAKAGTFEDELDTYDVDFQHGLSIGERNRFVWGLAYRSTHDQISNAPSIAFLPEKLNQELYSAFLQDEFSLVPEKLVLTLGSKFEHNDYTGWQTIPNARLQWSLDDSHTLWAAVSRAVRNPSRIDRDLSQPAPGTPPFFLVLLAGGANFDSEDVVAWETGYRAQLGTRLLASVALFYNEYDNIRSTSLSPTAVLLPFFFDNNLEGETHGLELTADYQMLDWWRLSGGYNLLKEDIRVKPGKFDLNKALNETADPEHQVTITSSMDLPNNVSVDFSLRWVDELIKNKGGVADEVPAYSELNLRLGWSPSETMELSLVGQNLLDNQHPEFGVSGPLREEIERSIYGKIAFRF
ncbi:MAG: TonB-dependent receptor [Pseudomonadota bacterium]